MRTAGLLRFARCILLGLAVPAVWAQNAAMPPTIPAAGASAAGTSASVAATPVSAAGASTTSAAASAAVPAATAPAVAMTGGAAAVKERITAIHFSRENPVLGLPLGGSTTRAHCSNDGTAFYDLAANGTAVGQYLYGISSNGGVKHVLRKLPIGYSHVEVRDFFVGDGQMVTLLEADKRNEEGDAASRDKDYFLSLEDEAGDLSSLVQMQVRFKPEKVARFGSGEVLLLGWDEGSQLPMLAMVKEDGTIHRFIDLDAAKPRAIRNASGDAEKSEAEAVMQERATQDSLEGAAFVANGNKVLLTYPGSTKPIVELDALGDERLIPLEIPYGYVLNDVLVSSGLGTLVARVKDADDKTKPVAADGVAKPPKMRLIEYLAYNGARLQEFTFDKPLVSDVTCAPNSALVAIFRDTIPDADHTTTSSGATGTATDAATQLVVATSRR